MLTESVYPQRRHPCGRFHLAPGEQPHGGGERPRLRVGARPHPQSPLREHEQYDAFTRDVDTHAQRQAQHPKTCTAAIAASSINTEKTVAASAFAL